MLNVIFFSVSALLSTDKQIETNIIQLEKVISQPSLLLETSIDTMEEKIWLRHSPLKKKSMKIVEIRSALKLKRDNIDLYNTKLIESNIDDNIYKTLTPNNNDNILIKGNSYINETLCKYIGNKKKQQHRKYCCKFIINMTTYYILNTTNLDNKICGDNFTNYYYRIGVYDGNKNFTYNNDYLNSGGIQVCGIIPCLNKNINSCGLRTDNFDKEQPTIAPPVSIQLLNKTYIKIGTTFNFINIETINEYNDSITYPLILSKGINNNEFGSLTDTNKFIFTKNEINNTNSLIINLQINNISDLGSVAIFTRIYNYPSSSIINKLCNSILILPIIINVYKILLF